MTYAKRVIEQTKEKYHHQPEFLQTVEEVLTSLEDFLEENSQYEEHKILERIVEPERSISFRVVWEDDKGEIQVNKGYRVQFNSAIGPFKGGLRFDKSVNESILKFLGFEQIFKNSLTGLPLGGGKGGSDFDPKGKSDREIMRFCQSFMNELFRHIGEDTDIPAGDIGVGGKEIGYLFGQYKKVQNKFTGVLTGKGLNYGGSLIRTEATGYGLLYFVQEVLNEKNEEINGKKILISGSGNVAQYAAQKAIHLGAIVKTMSDSSGFILKETGITLDELDWIIDLKEKRNGRLKEFAEEFEGVKYFEGEKPWDVEADIALPCATQNEIEKKDAQNLIKGGVKFVVEGSNMSSTNEAIELIDKNEIIYVPGKASNAGGVATSGLEMSQNSQRMYWDKNTVDNNLKEIMKNIHEKIKENGKFDTKINYVKGANVAGFKKVADAMIAQGLV